MNIDLPPGGCVVPRGLYFALTLNRRKTRITPEISLRQNTLVSDLYEDVMATRLGSGHRVKLDEGRKKEIDWVNRATQ